MYKLLVAEDEASVRNTICQHFPWNNLNFEVVFQAENGVEALSYIKNNVVDVVLCDIKMPIMSGIELAEVLSSEYSEIKIIFISAYRDFDYAKKAMDFKVRKYIVKPATFEDIMETFTELKNVLDKESLSNSTELKVKNININDKVIQTIKEYVGENYKTANLNEASSKVYMSPNYLSQFFQQKTGEKFSVYVNSVKMEKAAELLSDIKYKTYTISELVGYSNPKNFTRAFRKYFGKSPYEYRNRGEVRNED